MAVQWYVISEQTAAQVYIVHHFITAPASHDG